MAQRPDLTPNVILVDGNGIMHARRAGVACFVGVRTGIPTIGVAKSLYCHDGISKSLINIATENRVRDLIVTLPTNEENMDLESKFSLIIDNRSLKAINRHEEENKHNLCPSNSNETMGDLMKRISHYCDGFAVEIEGTSGNIWGATLVGHGGKINQKGIAAVGTKNPIFISVGHKISLHKALCICAELSIARIPEPVRQADLFGRELMRNYHNESHRKKI